MHVCGHICWFGPCWDSGIIFMWLRGWCENSAYYEHFVPRYLSIALFVSSSPKMKIFLKRSASSSWTVNWWQFQNGQPESSKSTEKENDTKREGKQEKQQLLKMKGIQQETIGSVFKEDVYPLPPGIIMGVRSACLWRRNQIQCCVWLHLSHFLSVSWFLGTINYPRHDDICFFPTVGSRLLINSSYSI